MFCEESTIVPRVSQAEALSPGQPRYLLTLILLDTLSACDICQKFGLVTFLSANARLCLFRPGTYGIGINAMPLLTTRRTVLC